MLLDITMKMMIIAIITIVITQMVIVLMSWGKQNVEYHVNTIISLIFYRESHVVYEYQDQSYHSNVQVSKHGKISYLTPSDPLKTMWHLAWSWVAQLASITTHTAHHSMKGVSMTRYIWLPPPETYLMHPLQQLHIFNVCHNYEALRASREGTHICPIVRCLDSQHLACIH